MLYTSEVELCQQCVGYVNIEVKLLVSLLLCNLHIFCIKTSNDMILLGVQTTVIGPDVLGLIRWMCRLETTKITNSSARRTQDLQ